MATSGSVGVVVTSHDSLWFNWVDVGQSIPNNDTTVNWELVLTSDAYGRINSTAPKSWWVNINGKYYDGTNTVGIGNSSRKVLASGSTVITHGLDGTKTFDFSFAQYFGITFSGASIGSVSGSGKGTLNSIPRISQPSLITYPQTTEQVGDMGKTITIHMNSAYEGFRHYVYCTFGDVRLDIAWEVQYSTSWKIPLDLANQVPNNHGGWGMVHAETWYGSTYIGTGSCKFWVNVPESVVPTIANISWSKTSSEPDSWPMTQGVSKGVLSMQGVQGAYGSTIRSYSLTFAGLSSSSSELTVSNIASSGKLKAIAKVVDSRGRPATKEVDFDVTAYTKPALNVSVFRCNNSGAEDPTGDCLFVKVSASITEVGNNLLGEIMLSYKRGTDTGYNKLELMPEEEAILIASSDYSWDWIISVSDLVSTVVVNGSIPTGEVVLDILANGKGIGLGKVAEREGLDSAWDFMKNGVVQIDYIVEQGTSDIWTYRKWASGVAECWGITGDISVNYTNPWQEIYYGDMACGFPDNLFVSAPSSVTISTISNQDLLENSINILEKTAVYWYAINHRREPKTMSVKFTLMAIGRWK